MTLAPCCSYTCGVATPYPPNDIAPVMAPSLLAADFSVDAARLVEGVADWLHVDIMDSVFVPNRTIGLDEVQGLRKATTIPFDCHLMIVEPELWATRYAGVGADTVTFHAEASDDPVALARDIRAAGAHPGLAIDRDTPIEPYLDLLPHFDLLLVMTIKAGLGGQDFRPELLTKVRAARRHVATGHLRLRIEVDGGIDEQTIAEAARAGADTFVAGTAVFDADDPVGMVRRLRALAEAQLKDRSP